MFWYSCAAGVAGNMTFAVNSQHAKWICRPCLSCWLEQATHGGEPQTAALRHSVLALQEVTLNTRLAFEFLLHEAPSMSTHLLRGPDKRNLIVLKRDRPRAYKTELTVVHCVTCLAFVGHAQSLLRGAQQSRQGVPNVSLAPVSLEQLSTPFLSHVVLPSAQDKQETSSTIIQGFMLRYSSRNPLSNFAYQLWGSTAEKTMM